MNLKTSIESLLFVSSRPLSFKKMAQLTSSDLSQVKEVVGRLIEEYNQSSRGIQIITQGQKIQMVTHPESGKLVKEFLKEEKFGELTKPSLETLTIVAYRGPITKPELEQIRGVNCSLILRNLMIKGLVEAEEDKKEMVTYYHITFDFLRHLGINKVSELPDYEKLNRDENLKKLLDQEEKAKEEN